MAQLIVMDGPGMGATFVLSRINTIGRSSRCSIRLKSSNLAPKQAVIRRRGNSYAIQPATSKGLIINGQPVSGERKLIHGDMIMLGDVMLLFGEEGDTSPAMSPAPVRGLTAVSDSSGPEPTIKSRQRFFEDTDQAIQSFSESPVLMRKMGVLLKVTNAIMAKVDLKELLSLILEIIFEEFPADRGTVILRDPKDRKLRPMAARKRKEIQTQTKLMASKTIMKEVLEHKEGILTRDALEDERFKAGLSIASQHIHSAICVPLVAKNGDVLGVIHIDTVSTERAFSEEDLKLVTGIAMQASMAIQNTFLIEQVGEKKQMERELNIASDIQMNLLPQQLPKLKDIEVYGLMIPAKEVGGDYYDFIVPEDQEDLYVCIGDVSGKGVPAGLVMVMARCFFRPLISSCSSTKQIIEELNRLLVADTRKDMFMSMLVIHWNHAKQKFLWTGAGHEHIIVYDSQNRTCRAIRAGGVVLGMLKKPANFFVEKELTLQSGDAIVLYTDGVTEASNTAGQMFELENLKRLVQKYGSKPTKQLCHSILNDLKKFMGKAEQPDDITIVVIKKK